MNVILKKQVFMVVPSNPSTPTLPLPGSLIRKHHPPQTKATLTSRIWVDVLQLSILNWRFTGIRQKARGSRDGWDRALGIRPSIFCRTSCIAWGGYLLAWGCACAAGMSFCGTGVVEERHVRQGGGSW